MPIVLAVALSTVGVTAASFVTGNVGAEAGPDVVISELMIDPKDVYDSRGEWIELHNRGDASADLAGWRITDGRLENVVLPSLTVAPGERVVLARDGDAYVNGGAEADWVYGNRVVLYNTSDRVILSNAAGEEQDRVDWYPESGITAPVGRSLALARTDADTADPASWCASTGVMTRGDLGSPGAPNSCDAPSDTIVITEVMQNPRRTSDASGEWFELYNPGEQPVDLAGWTVKDDDRNRFTIPTSVVVPAGGYAVLARSATSNGGITPDYVYGASMALQNDWDELAIADADGTLVDRLAWDDGKSFPDPDGASMTVLDPAGDNAAAATWCTSTSAWASGDRGTPHAASWCTAPGTDPIVVTEVMFDPETPASERAAEWFEVSNLGTAPVDMTGWTITAGDFKVHTITGLVVDAGDAVVLAASSDPIANGDVTADYVYGTSPDLPLYNTTGRVILKTPTGSVADRVEWSAAKNFPMPSGASITLGFPTTNNELGTNWCASAARWGSGDFGSPGEPGPCEPAPAPPAVTISEIMRNPAASTDTDGEWFEVHNGGDTDVDLIGWSLTDGASDRHVVRSSVVVPAGGYAVLGRTADVTVNGGAGVDYAYGNAFVLSNDTDRIVVRDRYDQLVDEWAWVRGDGWGRPNGGSMARVTDGWCISGPQFGLGDLGTPGTANDCTPLPHADVVISEIHADPDATSDTAGEWLELTNRSAAPIDLNGWVLRDDDADNHRISGTDLVVGPGESIVLGRDVLDEVTGGAGARYGYGSAFPLTNTDDEVTLLDPSLVWVDRVTWTATSRLPFTAGASAALRSFDLDNSEPSNWCTSTATFGTLGDRGTPATPNDCGPIDGGGAGETTTTTTTTTIPETTTTTTVPETTTTTTVPETTTTTTSTTTTTTTTTTTLPPAPGPGLPFTGGYVLLATGAGNACACGLQLSGSSIDIDGSIRSNGHMMLQGSSVKVDGTVSYGGTPNISNKVEAGKIVKDTKVVPSGLPFGVADFAPGGKYSSDPDYQFINGNWNPKYAAPGIYYVTGNVTISASKVDIRGLTIVATGTVTISGSKARLAPFRADLPTVLAGGGACHQAAINVSGSETEWEGLLAAPNGLVQVNGSKSRGGQILGLGIQVSGSDIRFD